VDSKDNRKEAVSYFKISEFDSKDGAEMPSDVKMNVIELIDNLNVLRQELGSPLFVNSGYRSPEHNKSIGGSLNSQHLTGKAADIRSNEYTPKQIKEKIEELIKVGKMKQGGLSAYNTFVHYDIRGKKARW
jgi:uncharacterized protein YcbK (DUF882 family)